MSRISSRGFSLLEVMVALIVFAFAFAAIMSATSHALAQARRGHDDSLAALYAQSRLDALGAGEKLKEGRESGRFDDTYRWTQEVKKLEPLAADDGKIELIPVDLFRVALTVTWGAPPNERKAEFVTLRAIQPDLANAR